VLRLANVWAPAQTPCTMDDGMEKGSMDKEIIKKGGISGGKGESM